MRYSIQDLIMLAAKLEPSMIEIGCHVAIGGSCVFEGSSSKDMDVMIYPHHDPVSKEIIIEKLESLRFSGKPLDPCYQDIPDVWVSMDGRGRRVDFFFLCRPIEIKESPMT